MRPRFRFDTRYGFAVGLIRVLEKRFLSKQFFDRLLVCLSPEEAGRVLSEGGYSGDFAGIRSWEEVEKRLEFEWRWALDLVCQFSLDPFWTDLFRRRTDYHNLKVLLKGELLEEPREDLLLEGGLVSVAFLKEEFESEGGEGLPPTLDKAVREVREAVSESRDPSVADRICDRLEAEEWNAVLWDHPNPFLESWRALEVDLFNLMTFLRVRTLREEHSVLRNSLLSGGSLDRDSFLRWLEEPWDGVLRALGRTDYGEMVSQAVRDLEEGHGFLGWERWCQEMRWRALQPARRHGFGVEVLFAYYFLKEMELSVVRRVLVGRANGLAGEAIAKGVPNVFF